MSDRKTVLRFLPIVLLSFFLFTGCASENNFYPNCEPPNENWRSTSGEEPPHLMVIHHIHIDPNGQFRWNNAITTLPEILNRLEQFDELLPSPTLALVPTKDASCEDLSKVRDLVDKVLDCNKSSDCNEGDSWLGH